MPAFMTIGKLKEYEVETGDIEGDATASWHENWMTITSFSVDMKDEETSNSWEVQDPKSRRERRKAQAEEKKAKQKEKPRDNMLTVTKPTDSASCKIFEWAKTSVRQDIQIDCCITEEDWPFLTMIFIGVVPTKAGFEEEPSDTLEFAWKKAMVFTYDFNEKNEPYAVDFAEFGEVEYSSATTTTEQRGLADYAAPAPDPNEGAGRTPAGRSLGLARAGGLPPVEEEKRVYDQERRRLVIEKVGELEFDLESFRGEERMSALFLFDLELRSTETKIDPADVVGHEVSFRIEDEEGREEEESREPRHFSGIIATFLAGEMESDRRRKYHATVVPSVWLLTQRSDSRVFQEVTVKDIVEDVFKAADFTDYDIQGVTRTYPELVCCIQYQESDFAFVSRLLEDAGIFYFFKQEEGKHTMVLCDGPTGYVRCPEDPLQFALNVHRDPRITSWRHHYEFVPGKFDSRDWNFETPREPVKGQSKTKLDIPGMENAEIFEYPGSYEDADHATTIADRRLQEREVGHHFVHAVGCYDSIVTGMTIAVENLPGEEEDASSTRYLITGIRHRAEQLPEYGLSIIGYQNVLTCIPEDVPYTPPRLTPKPRIYGPQTAVVVGDKETDEDVVDTDKYGRIKVQFHWDREGAKDTESSCWIRVAQSLAGSGYGAMALPRIGWEVVVSFIDGDPDHPLVTGVVYNELHMPYHELPGAKHKTVLMTRSFPDGGKENFNELTFHDEKDKEEIYFHAERDFKRVVEHDDVLEIGEKETGGQTVTIEGDQAITINQGNQALTVKQGNQAVDVTAGSSELKAGQTIELKVGANSVKIDSSGITLTVGSSSVKVDNSGVTVKGMTVKSEATMSAEIKGMMVNVTADGMLQTKGSITMMQ